MLKSCIYFEDSLIRWIISKAWKVGMLSFMLVPYPGEKNWRILNFLLTCHPNPNYCHPVFSRSHSKSHPIMWRSMSVFYLIPIFCTQPIFSCVLACWFINIASTLHAWDYQFEFCGLFSFLQVPENWQVPFIETYLHSIHVYTNKILWT